MLEAFKENLKKIRKKNVIRDFKHLIQLLLISDFGDQYDVDDVEIQKLITDNNIDVGYGSLPERIPTEVKQTILQNNVVQTFEEGGKGRKQCPDCRKYLAAVSKRCNCGYQFLKEKVAESPVVEEPQPVRYRGNVLTISIPAGLCPYKLSGIEPHDVIEWAKKVRAFYENKNQHLKLEGLIYYTRHMFGYGTPNYKAVEAELTAAESERLI